MWCICFLFFFFSSRRRHTRWTGDWSSDVCSSDLVTMLLATAVLFYVSYWLLSKIEVAKWNAFVKGRMEEALSTGSGFALASVAFLAVYREGFETILFYKALLTSAGSAGGASGAGPVAAGLLLGGVAA